MNGVADEVELETVVEDTDVSGPEYGAEEMLVMVAPIPRGIVFVLPEGETDDRLVVYEELGRAPRGI